MQVFQKFSKNKYRGQLKILGARKLAWHTEDQQILGATEQTSGRRAGLGGGPSGVLCTPGVVACNYHKQAFLFCETWVSHGRVSKNYGLIGYDAVSLGKD